jgi:hypothetical protein
MSNPNQYKKALGKYKMIMLVINKVFYTLAYLRLKYNFFKVPIEAMLFLFLVNIIENLTKNSH